MSDAREPRAVRFEVFGRVQGVFFRDFTHGTAAELGVTGWVRNRDDGAVEGEAVGDDEQLRAFETALRRGSRHARVDRFASQPLDHLPSFADFEIRF